MNGAILAALIAIAAPVGEAAPASSPAAPSTVETAQDDLAQAQQLYDQSCSDRAYAAYDDLCNELAERVRQYRIDLDRSQRDAARRPKATAPTPKL